MTKKIDDDEIQKIASDKIDCPNSMAREFTLISENALHEILSSTRKISIEKKRSMYKWLTGRDFSSSITKTAAEREFIKMLDEAITSFTEEIYDWRNNFFNYIEQYKILNYKIDIFFKNAKVIVEYDENFHNHQKCHDENRMNDIIFELLKNEDNRVEYETKEGYVEYIEKKDFCYTKHNRTYKIVRVKKGEEFKGVIKIIANVVENFM